MRIFWPMLSASLLAGCAGSPVGDALRGPEKLAQEDDAYCRSIGAQGDAYTNCRLVVAQQRAAGHAARMQAIGNVNWRPVGSSPSVTCTTTGPASMRTTTCQ